MFVVPIPFFYVSTWEIILNLFNIKFNELL